MDKNTTKAVFKLTIGGHRLYSNFDQVLWTAFNTQIALLLRVGEKRFFTSRQSTLGNSAVVFPFIYFLLLVKKYLATIFDDSFTNSILQQPISDSMLPLKNKIYVTFYCFFL